MVSISRKMQAFLLRGSVKKMLTDLTFAPITIAIKALTLRRVESKEIQIRRLL